jgi:hypothetical protein
MIAAIIVLLNGVFVPSAPPPRRVFGAVMVPLAPIVARIADRVTLDGDTITLVRGTRVCAFTVGSPAYRCDGVRQASGVVPFARDGIVYLPLGAVVRAFGGTVTFDARSGTVAVTLPRSNALLTPPPFDANAPQATPTRVFTPQPAPPTPQVPISGDPRPRRTAIPATPSRVPG